MSRKYVKEIFEEWIKKEEINIKEIIKDWLNRNDFPALFNMECRCFCFSFDLGSKCKCESNALPLTCFPVKFVISARDSDGNKYHLKKDDEKKFEIKLINYEDDEKNFEIKLINDNYKIPPKKRYTRKGRKKVKKNRKKS